VVVHSVTPVVEYGAQVKAYAAQYGPQLAVVESHPAIVPMLEELEKGVTPAARAQAQRILGPTYLQTVAELNRGGPGLVAAVAFVDAHGTSVASAAKNEPDQWKNWYWVCFGGMVIFLMTVPLMRGRWSPKAAKADQKAHEALVEAEMTRIGISA
jgi:hypothetical protein